MWGGGILLDICVCPLFPESPRRELVTSLVEEAEEITLSMHPPQPSNLSNSHPRWDVFIKPIPSRLRMYQKRRWEEDGKSQR